VAAGQDAVTGKPAVKRSYACESAPPRAHPAPLAECQRAEFFIAAASCSLSMAFRSCCLLWVIPATISQVFFDAMRK
jgi:hypothetical protein